MGWMGLNCAEGKNIQKISCYMWEQNVGPWFTLIPFPPKQRIGKNFRSHALHDPFPIFLSTLACINSKKEKEKEKDIH